MKLLIMISFLILNLILASSSYAKEDSVEFKVLNSNNEFIEISFNNLLNRPLLCSFTFAVGFQDEMYNYKMIKTISLQNYPINKNSSRNINLNSFYYDINSLGLKFQGIKLVKGFPNCHSNFSTTELIKGIQSALGNGHFRLAKEIYESVPNKNLVKYLDVSLSDFNPERSIEEIISFFDLNYLEITNSSYFKLHQQENYNQCLHRKNKICGIVYFERKSRFCGVKFFKKLRSPRCKIQLYKLKRSKRCGCEKRSGNYFNCLNGCECVKYRECRHEGHGAEKYFECRHKGHGIEEYRKCRNSNHGIENVKSCNILFDENLNPIRCMK